MSQLTPSDVLSRVNLSISLSDVAAQVVDVFALGTVVSIEPLLVGYEEVNALLVTGKGKFIVKIFSKQKDLATIQSNVRALDEYYRGGVPVSKLYKTASGEFLYTVANNAHDTYLIVMDYFDGEKFTDIEPTFSDFTQITEYIARIHALSFETSPTYDMWLTLYLAEQFDEKKDYLDEADRALMQPVVDQFRAVDMNKFSQSIVHFDLHRENVMKNTKGEYCILDLATCTYSYSIFDLATFIALFCFDAGKSLEHNQEVYDAVIAAYQKFRPLTGYELVQLPLLIRATFASNFLIATYVQKAGLDDNPEQTVYYQSLGKNGLCNLSHIHS